MLEVKQKTELYLGEKHIEKSLFNNPYFKKSYKIHTEIVNGICPECEKEYNVSWCN